MESLKTYSVYLKVFVLAEDENDALDSVFNAVDSCDLLSQDGIAGIEIIEEVEDEYDNDID
jgi:hypothetical protein